MEHRWLKAGDAPHEGLLKFERRGFGGSGFFFVFFLGEGGWVFRVFRGF